MDPAQPYRLHCTLTFGDIYGQILIWMLVIIVSLAAGLALMGASKPIFALVAFTTTLLNHIALEPASRDGAA
jgi:hypothetical protein